MTQENKGIFSELRDVGNAEYMLDRCIRERNDEVVDFLNEMLGSLLQNEKDLIGKADSFHNLSVSVSKILHDNDAATRIAKAGLRIHEKNTDLLADGIIYGKNCSDGNFCRKCLQTLLSIPQERWTWRAFSFTKDYMTEEVMNAEGKEYTKEDILNIVKSYQEKFPEEEDAWLCEFEVYNDFNEKKKAFEFLKEAIARFKFCPKCWLRYADLLVDKGDYQGATTFIEKINKFPKSAESVNAAYVLYLEGLSNYTILKQQDEYEDYEFMDEGETKEKIKRKIYKIFKSFRKALASNDLRDNIREQINTYLNNIYYETGIEYPETWKA